MSHRLRAALKQAEDAFDTKPPMEERETGFEEESLEDHEIQVRKACRAIAAADELVRNAAAGIQQRRHYAAAIELSFCAAERSCHAVLMQAEHVDPDDIPPHHEILSDSHLAGLWTEDESQVLAQLYKENRAAHYYRRGIPSLTKAQAMLALAEEIHYLAVQGGQLGSVCLCT